MIEYQIWRRGDGYDEEVCAYETLEEARRDLPEYRLSDPVGLYRIRKVRVAGSI
jgi:hypothetical protein